MMMMRISVRLAIFAYMHVCIHGWP